MTDSCCPPGSLPALQEDTARTLSGTVENKLYYSAPPAASTKGIVVIYDVFGFSGGRIKSVCDQIALAGFHVAMPDGAMPPALARARWFCTATSAASSTALAR